MMRTRTIVMTVVALSSTATLRAQGPTVETLKLTAATPALCTKGASDWRNEKLQPIITAARTAPPEKRTELVAAYNAAYPLVNKESVRAAKECAAAFDVETIAPAQLVDLVNLYSFVNDTAGQRRATARALTAKGLPPRPHAKVLLLALQQEIANASSYFGIIDGAEKVLVAIDALPDSLDDIKLSAHSTMLGRYEYLDVADGLRTQSLAVLTLARKLSATGPTATTRLNAMTSAYQSLARSHADMLHPDSALAILDRGEAEIGPSAKERFADFRHRYALIGTKAEAIAGQWWINSADNSPVRMDDGKVHFIEFTAHWCGPCKNSYPGVKGLGERFKAAPFEGTMVTSLYGYLGDKKNLTPDQEVEADREYFGKEHALPFRVAINPQPKQTGNTFVQPKPDTDYRVGGIPQIIVVDRKGIIRQIITGWDQGNTKRLGDLITALLAEGTK